MAFYSNTPVIFEGISGVVTTLVSKSPQIGSRVNYEGNDYVYVYNGGNSEISKGYGICPQTAATGFTGTITSVAKDPFLGVVVHATLPTASWGWVCNKGIVPVAIASAAAVGTAFSVSADGVFATYVCGTTGKEVGKILTASSGSTAIATAYICL